MKEFDPIGEYVAGYKVLDVGDIYVKVNGKLICNNCNKNSNELVAIKENDRAYCIKCFFNNRKKLYKVANDQDFVSIAFIRN